MFLRIIIGYLTIFKLDEYIQGYFKKFPPESKNHIDYKIASFLANQKTLTTQNRIRTAMDFIRANTFNYVIYFILIEDLVKSRRFEEAQKYLDEVLIKWPEEKTTFTKFVKQYSEIKSPNQEEMSLR